MTLAKRVTVTAVVALVSTFALAQIPLARGQKYVLRVPLEALTLETVSAWSGSAVHVGAIEQSGTEVAVNGSTTWLGQGFPIDKPMTIKKLRTDRRSGQYEVEFGGDFAGEPIVKLRFASETAAAASASAILISASQQEDINAFREVAYSELAKRTFTGQLAQLPVEKQRKLLVSCHALILG